MQTIAEQDVNMMRQETRFELSVYPSRDELGKAAAADIAAAIGLVVAEQGEARVVFGAAPSQHETLAALISHSEVDWTKVHAFHMDEYLGLPPGAPERFGEWLKREFFERVRLASVEYMQPERGAENEALRYGGLVSAAPIDVVCLGIGVNGHIAFNDPPVADFDDVETVKVVDLDDVCREQQVSDGAFLSLDDVPTRALTLTIPALMAGRQLFCMVPGASKRHALAATMTAATTTRWPATILRTHPRCRIYSDTSAVSAIS